MRPVQIKSIKGPFEDLKLSKFSRFDSTVGEGPVLRVGADILHYLVSLY